MFLKGLLLFSAALLCCSTLLWRLSPLWLSQIIISLSILWSLPTSPPPSLRPVLRGAYVRQQEARGVTRAQQQDGEGQTAGGRGDTNPYFDFCRQTRSIPTCVFLQSTVRVVFHDRRLQYTEHQQLEGWKWNRPGDRLLDIGNAAWPNFSH